MNAKKGKFSVKSCYNFLGQEKAKKFPTRAIWNVIFFFFLIDKEENILKRGVKGETQGIQDLYTHCKKGSNNIKRAIWNAMAPTKRAFCI